ncbi:MAG: transporter [Crocinitomicaceae bacterium]|nr:transporter [Crocinitomicaceae bacterium]
MWNNIASFLIRQRLLWLVLLALGTAFMAKQIPNLRLQYTFSGLLPADDSIALDYARFQEVFGTEGNVILIGADLASLSNPEGLLAWEELARSIHEMETLRDTLDDGVDEKVQISLIDSVFSITRAFDVEKDIEKRQFVLTPLVPRGRFQDESGISQQYVDSLMNRLLELPFYEGLLFNESHDATLLSVFMNPELFDSKHRGAVVEDVVALTDAWSERHGLQLSLSGLPFIRVQMTNKVKNEIGWFIGAALLVTMFLLFLFFRNPIVTGVSLIVVGTGVIWSLGTIALFDFPVNLIMSLIPPLMIVIGVPNCIYLINKYHAEFKRHGNKAMALQRMIVKVGNATLLTNFTTALGFATFIFTHSEMLRNFGIVTALNILGMFVISIVVIPAMMAGLPAPKVKHTRHLDRRWMFTFVNRLAEVVENRRPRVYAGAVLLLLFSIGGIFQMQTTGNIVDDLPDQDRVIKDLKWMEQRFGGAMPFEIMIDTHRPNGVTGSNFLKRVDKLQRVLDEYPEYSRSISAADATKFAFQAFKNGHPKNYRLPRLGMEKTQFGPWVRGTEASAGNSKSATDVASKFFNEDRSIARVSAQMMDIGTLEMRTLMDEIKPRLDSIFPAPEYSLILTGTSVTFLEGTTYMVKNLGISIALAICVIAIMMALLFKSSRMVGIALLPNLFPLMFTAGIMGWLGIPIKPSTILVFSIAFGISVDDTIHFLAKYRQELNLKAWNIKDSVMLALKETGVSMMYTSIVLFCGFLMFAMSEFEGTRYLGLLVSITLGVAMFTNLLLLPSLLLAFEKSLTTRSFSEPFFSILDEEEDIEVEELEIQRGFSPGKGNEQHASLRNDPSKSDSSHSTSES